MNEFWSVAIFLALAVLALVAALAFVLPFLWRDRNAARIRAARRDINLAVYRDQLRELKAEFSGGRIAQAQYLATKLELETRAAEDAVVAEEGAPAPAASPAPASSRWLGVGLAALLPVAAFGMYFWLGNPGVLTAIASGQGAVPANAQPSREDIVAMIGQIESRTQTHPDDAMAWEALAMANGMAGRWPEAVQAYARAHELQPAKPSVLAGYAESLAMANNQVLAGRPIELVNQALQIDPRQPKALELAVIHAYQAGDYGQAIAFIDRLAQMMPPDSADGREVQAMRNDALRRAQALSGGAVAQDLPAAVPGANPPSAGGPVASVSGRVDVAEALKSRIGPQDTVFVLARAGEGGPPLAAVRVPVGPLPLQFRLDDSTAMMPGNVLSMHQEVVLVARISASGNPIAQPGDLEGRLTGVAVGSADVRLVIDRVLP
jgi:cytochrome c-type biogenesis protein CcmH